MKFILPKLVVSLLGVGCFLTPHVNGQNNGRIEQLPSAESKRFDVKTKPLEVRIKDITRIHGVQTETLSGWGLVTGLSGTGSNGLFTKQMALQILEAEGNRIPADFRQEFLSTFQSINLAVVRITAELPAFAFEGQEIDVTVSMFDGATSLKGGKLSVVAPLAGADEQIYAVAKGPILVGGFSAGGEAASVQKNNVSNGKIVGGGKIVKVLDQPKLGADGFVDFHLRNQDRLTAVRIAEAINKRFPKQAQIVGGQAIRVLVPMSQTQSKMDKFLSQIQELRVIPDSRAKVVINENSGTIVITENAMLRPVVTSVGNLTIATTESPQVSQPPPFSGGDTVVTPQTDLRVTEDQNTLRLLPGARSLRDLVDSLNTLGVSAQEMMSVLQSLKASGALQAELVVE